MLSNLLLLALLLNVSRNFCITNLVHEDRSSVEKAEVPQRSEQSGGGEVCGCQTETECDQALGPAIDIRIVTPPEGVECVGGSVYCCITDPHQCGVRGNVSSPPTTDGQSHFGDFPWQAVIVDLDSNYVGSGAIIDELHVLTAAHKVAAYDRQELVVRVGDWDVRSDREPLPYQDVRVTSLRLHPNYDRSTLAYDAAVLTLAQALRLYPDVPHVNSICLPLPSTQFTGERCWVSGWGKDAWGPSGRYQSVQKAVDVGVVSAADCETRLRRTRLGRHFTLDHHSFLCAGGDENKDACTGDGGAPLVCESLPGHWTLAGLVAWGVGCAQPTIPGVYVNVPSMVPWIQQCVQPQQRTNISALNFIL